MHPTGSHSSKYEKNYKFFKVHLRLLHLAGILPRPGLFTSPWRAICYNTFPIISVAWCVPPLLAVLYSMYESWGDISVVTGMVFQLSFVVYCIGIYTYLILNRKSLQKMISTSEVAFARYIKHLDLDIMGLYDTVMTRACRQNTILTRTLLAININAYIFWTVYPFILWCSETENEIKNTENSEINSGYDEGQWKYFCYRMWVPQNATQTPMYQFIYTYQALENSFLLLTYATHLMLILSLLLHLTSQFKVLTAYLERVDNVPLYLKEVLRSNENISDTKQKEHGHSAKEQNTATNNGQLGQRGKREVDTGWAATDTLDMLHISNDAETCRYLVNCVKYHQLILQHAEDMIKLLSPVFFIDFVVGLAMMCTTTFQLAVGSEQGINFKTLAAAVSVWYPIFLICWFGERLSEQCERLLLASCRCCWYIRTPRFKRILFLLILRAQKPVQFNAGRFFIVSLETFSNMANNVYAFYTVLKRMHDS